MSSRTERLNKESENFSLSDLIYMVSHKCRKQQDSKESCNGCDFLNCDDECVLMGMDENIDPSDWDDIEVEKYREEDIRELNAYERHQRYLEAQCD